MKAGCTVDAAFNVMYAPNTNALKLSSSGQDTGERYQALIKAYNNTIINAGWGRDPDKPKGGSIWLEQGALVEIYNNLIVNSMFAVRKDGKKPHDENSKVDYNFYASGTQKVQYHSTLQTVLLQLLMVLKTAEPPTSLSEQTINVAVLPVKTTQNL